MERTGPSRRSTRRALLALLLGMVGIAFAGSGQQAADAEPSSYRLRLVPARVVATRPWTAGDATPASFAALRAWAQESGHVAIGPDERAYERRPRKDPRGPAPHGREAIRVPVRHAGRAVLPGAKGPHLRRLPAVLVLERGSTRAEEPGKGSGVPAPPLEEMARRGVAYAGRYDVVVQDAVPPTRRRPRTERWHVVPTKRADVGIYTDHGAHRNAVTTAAAACLDAGLMVCPVTSGDVNDGSFRERIRTLLMPGGWAGDYLEDVDPEGAQHVRAFVEEGGGYVGVCAGAFFAAAHANWSGEAIDYPLDLLEGTAEGPIPAIAPWPKHALAEFELLPSHSLARGLGTKRSAFYLGGPWFRVDVRKDPGIRVVARYARNGKPAILTVRRRRGRVFLSGLHVEYDLTSERDDLAWPENEGRLEDPEADWDLFQRGVRWTLGGTR